MTGFIGILSIAPRTSVSILKQERTTYSATAYIRIPLPTKLTKMQITVLTETREKTG